MALLISIPAMASSATIGNVVTLSPTAGAGLIFSQTGTRTARPGCAIYDRWVIDVGTPSGQVMASTLLTAYSLNKRVILYGTGTCTAWPDTETVSYFVVEN
jgi:hypothetical protein